MSMQTKDIFRVLDKICFNASEERGRERANRRNQHTGDDTRAPVKHAYSYIPLTTDSMAHVFTKARQIFVKGKTDANYLRPTLLDAGCGIGMSAAIADAAHLKGYGIEMDQTCFTRARQIFGKEFVEDRIKKANILKFRKYGEYDIIYFYVPFRSQKLQRQMEERIARQMKVGALVIPVGAGYIFEESKKFKKVFPNTRNGPRHGNPCIFRKIKK